MARYLSSFPLCVCLVCLYLSLAVSCGRLSLETAISINRLLLSVTVSPEAFLASVALFARCFAVSRSLCLNRFTNPSRSYIPLRKTSSMRLLCVYGLMASVVGSVAADPDFMSVRTQLAKEWSGKGGDPGEKYFHESSFHPHYDGRFASQALPEEESLPHLISLVQTYFTTMNDLGVETWIMHGSLLGWWWNQKILPWDSDLDVQISEPGMHFLGDHYNMTEHHYDIPGVPEGRTYMLEINPNYVIRTTEDRNNLIDARWIDTSSGLFIDITAVRADDENRAKGQPGALMCKDSHRYDESDIFPLRDSIYEGGPVKIPYRYAKLLSGEYGGNSLTNTKFAGHTFVEEEQRWIKDEQVEALNQNSQNEQSAK